MVDASRDKLIILTGTLLNRYKLKNSHLDRSESCVSLIIIKKVSMEWCLLRLSAKILTLLRLSVNFFQLRLTKK